MQSLPEMLEIVRKGAQHMSAMVDNMDYPWPPSEQDITDPRRIHNVYARCLISAYASKFAQLSEVMLQSIDNQQFLAYGLSGRSLIEHTATLRYYIMSKYKPLMDHAQSRGTLSPADMKRLIVIDVQHLHGGRFDWESFFLRRYAQLRDEAVKQLAAKKAKQKQAANEILSEQVNVLTCVESWAVAEPSVLVVYGLFCDLVHPNIGSSFLIASSNAKGLYFSPFFGQSMGVAIYEQSLPLLVSSVCNTFGECITLLMGTIWHEDEMNEPIQIGRAHV